MSDLVLLAPLHGWVAPLDEVPDEVFAGRMMGDGLAIDPTGTTLIAPCDGELTVVPESAHAVTIRATNGAEILLHVGIDTVALKGAGFSSLVRVGQTVSAGDPLLRLDLDRLARSAKSLVTPVVVTDPDRFRIVERRAFGPVAAGEPLMTIARSGAAARAGHDPGAGVTIQSTLTVPLPHGLHARPAALLAQSLRNLRANVTLSLAGKTANARSAVALLALGARHGDSLALLASGIDAGVVPGVLEQALAKAAVEVQVPAPAGARTASVAAGSGVMPGIAASPGLAIGVAARVARPEAAVPMDGAGAQEELRRLDDARERLRQRLQRTLRASGAAAGIVGAHLEFLDDPELAAAAHRQIAAGRSAGFAWRAAVSEVVQALAAIDDAHLAARADDLRDLEWQMLELLAGGAEVASLALPERAILVARDLLPSQFLALDTRRMAGICTVGGSATSHVAILAGARDIPMLVGISQSILSVHDGTPLLLDADRAAITVSPDAARLAEAEERIARRVRIQARRRAAAALDCCTADGERIEVFANVGSVAEATAAVDAGAEGCGLLRTEFMFLDRSAPPDAREQAREYQRIADAFGERPVVVRTLDAGNDKPLSFIAMPPEANPALGLRGIRASLQRPELLRQQLTAILAVRPLERCRILLPMINEVAEIRSVRELLDEIAAEAGLDLRIPVGVMIETPASAVNAARLARHADFFSIGTNDLTQYVLAIDRTHPQLGAGLDALHPAVLRLIAEVAIAGNHTGRSVAVCGGLASEPEAAALLVGLGVRELSAPPAAIPAVKEAVRQHTIPECRALAERALALEAASEVRALLAETASGDSP